MTTNDLLVRIKSRYNQLTKAEKKVADLVLSDPARILFMSITDLAEACDVGDTSVFRFCKTLKLKGYQDFKLQLSLGMSHADSGVSPAIDARDATFMRRAQAVMDQSVMGMAETHSLLREETVQRIVHMLVEAERVFFFGVGSSMLSAKEAMNRFMHISSKFYSLTDTHMQAMAASLMGPRDLVFVLSYSGNTKDSVQIAQLAYEAGAKVVGISHFLKSPLTAFTHELLLCGSPEAPLQGGSARGKMSQLYLIDLLCSEYFLLTEAESKERNKKTSEAVSEKLY